MPSGKDTANLKDSKINKNMFIKILRYLIPYRKYMILAIILTFAVSILQLLPPILVRYIVDKALPNKNVKLLCLFIIISILATILASLFQTGQFYLNIWTAKHIIFNIKNQMYNHLQYMDLSFITSTKSGEITTRITSDIDGVQEIFNSILINAISNVFILTTTAIVLITMNWKLAILGMIILPFFVMPVRKVGRISRIISAKVQEKLSELNQIIQETLGISGFSLMKIFAKENNESEKFQKANKELINLQIKGSLAGRWVFTLVVIFTSIGPLLIYLYGGYLFIHNDISIGSIIAFVALLARLYLPVTQLSNTHIEITRSLAYFQRIFDYLDRKPEITDKPDALVMQNILGKVDFENVYFSYNGKNKILDNIDFSVTPGSIVAFVGSSGAGKTTVTNLIPRLYEPTKGSIKIDGIDIRDVTLTSLRKQIGIIMQEPYLFNDTIAENLRYGKSDATKEEMIHACKIACIHDFILTLPEGYQTIVGNRGFKLSGGEKQRVSIARVILQDPRIIIFDEATSSLDSVSEMLIQKAMIQLLKGRTSLVIAHRLSTVIAADQIFVMENGHIVEMGKHEELLEKKGLYRKLYDTQFKLAPLGSICKIAR